MNFIIPLLIITLMAIPAYASGKVAKPIKQKQTVVVHNKQLTQKQLKEAKRAVKEKKCRKVVDVKTKKEYYICN